MLIYADDIPNGGWCLNSPCIGCFKAQTQLGHFESQSAVASLFPCQMNVDTRNLPPGNPSHRKIHSKNGRLSALNGSS